MHCSSRGFSPGGENSRGWTSGSWDLSTSAFLCALPLWIFKPFSDFEDFPHWSHLKDPESDSDFLCRNSSFLFWFLLNVEGLDFFFFFCITGVVPSLVSREKVKEEPRVRERLKAWPLLASTWQNSRHWVSRAGSSPLRVEGIVFTGKGCISEVLELTKTTGMSQSFYLKKLDKLWDQSASSNSNDG